VISSASLALATNHLGNEQVQQVFVKYACRKAALAHLVGRAMTVHALDSHDVTIGSHGKPLHAEYSFNVSHTEQLVVGAFSNHSARNVGIDVLADGRYSQAVVEKRFSENERSLVAEDRAHFGRIWTMKEAYLKAIGQGIRFGLERVTVESIVYAQ